MQQKPVQVFLSPDLKAWLQAYAAQHNLSMTTVIKLLLERERGAGKHLTKHERPLYEKMGT